MDAAKLARVAALVKGHMTYTELVDLLEYDWPEAETQDWQDTAPDNDIADWAIVVHEQGREANTLYD